MNSVGILHVQHAQPVCTGLELHCNEPLVSQFQQRFFKA